VGVDLIAKMGVSLGIEVKEIKVTYSWSPTICVFASRPVFRFDGHQFCDLAAQPVSTSRDYKQHVADRTIAIDVAHLSAYQLPREGSELHPLRLC